MLNKSQSKEGTLRLNLYDILEKVKLQRWSTDQLGLRSKGCVTPKKKQHKGSFMGDGFGSVSLLWEWLGKSMHALKLR